MSPLHIPPQLEKRSHAMPHGILVWYAPGSEEVLYNASLGHRAEIPSNAAETSEGMSWGPHVMRSLWGRMVLCVMSKRLRTNTRDVRRLWRMRQATTTPAPTARPRRRLCAVSWRCEAPAWPGTTVTEERLTPPSLQCRVALQQSEEDIAHEIALANPLDAFINAPRHRPTRRTATR